MDFEDLGSSTIYYSRNWDPALLKVVSYSAVYWHVYRLDAGRFHRVVDKGLPFVAVHFGACSHKFRVVHTCVRNASPPYLYIQ